MLDDIHQTCWKCLKDSYVDEFLGKWKVTDRARFRFATCYFRFHNRLVNKTLISLSRSIDKCKTISIKLAGRVYRVPTWDVFLGKWKVTDRARFRFATCYFRFHNRLVNKTLISLSRSIDKCKTISIKLAGRVYRVPTWDVFLGKCGRLRIGPGFGSLRATSDFTTDWSTKH